MSQRDLLDAAAPNERAGFRLHRLELFNWGTFGGRVWAFQANGETSLLTGDIGSGKSTIVDALTTLLVPPQKLAYNKAAGAEAKERSLRSYFFGHYKSERSESGSGARPIALRDEKSYSVLLGQFYNEGYKQHVTLAQVFWMRDKEGQPARLLVVADQPLNIADHFSGFGSDIADLRKRLRKQNAEVSESFPPYQAAFRKRFGIHNEQALDLFHQTVSMKSVGNLTDFVRQHMLQPASVDERIAKLNEHVDALSGAHEAVLKAKRQLQQLAPIVASCDEHDVIAARITSDRSAREALKPWFALLLVDLVQSELDTTVARVETLTVDVSTTDQHKLQLSQQRDLLKRDIALSGGDRIERLKSAVQQFEHERDERQERAQRYQGFAEEAGLSNPDDAHGFARNSKEAASQLSQSEDQKALLRQQELEASVALQKSREEQGELSTEIETLARRKSNIHSEQLQIRQRLCVALSVEETALPFAGELMRVHSGEKPWEGAIERVVRAFALSMLVPDAHYSAVSHWVDQNHLRGKLVYLRPRSVAGRRAASNLQSLSRKLEFKHDGELAEWVEDEATRRFPHVCCDTIDEFRREKDALTRLGQVKSGNNQHTKDDRRAVDDRANWVLGWANHEKLALLRDRLGAVERHAHQQAQTIAQLQDELQRLERQLDALKKLAVFESYDEVDWRSRAICVADMQRQLDEARSAASEVLQRLEAELARVDDALTRDEDRLRRLRDERSKAEQRRIDLEGQLDASTSTASAATEAERLHFDRLAQLRTESVHHLELTLKNAEHQERALREWLQSRIDAEASRLSRVREDIVKKMQEYRGAWPVETREADASLDAASEYRRMLEQLRNDDLPRFERRFKELLNENTIREVAGFQSWLAAEREVIGERIETINKSLKGIEFNAGRYIQLEAAPTQDVEVRDFHFDLRSCTEGTLVGSADETYSEAKFLQVKKIIERFRGREGSADADQRWTQKVTDVRNWFIFSVSERWAEDDREHEHYTDSGGKSGGQKEKLAYTVLAASLAYQFGLEWGEARSKSFRFVVIDEAFGRGSDESAEYGLELFKRLNLQLLVVTPLQKIHVIEPFVSNVGFVSNPEGNDSRLRNLTIEQYREEKKRRAG